MIPEKRKESKVSRERTRKELNARICELSEENRRLKADIWQSDVELRRVKGENSELRRAFDERVIIAPARYPLRKPLAYALLQELYKMAESGHYEFSAPEIMKFHWDKGMINICDLQINKAALETFVLLVCPELYDHEFSETITMLRDSILAIHKEKK